MDDLDRILPLWRELESAAADYVLATVVAVEGSSYRRPGACMLLAPDGRRAGTVSGGCLEGEHIARRAFAGLEPAADLLPALVPLQQLAQQTLESKISIDEKIAVQGTQTRAWTNFRPARPGLGIFGAGDDAQPLLRLAKELGWFVTVADGRSHLVTRDRFPLADELHILPVKDMPLNPANGPTPALASLCPHDAAVLMTHSFEQDSRVLASLLAASEQPAYIGVLGPQRRTRELLAEATLLLRLPVDPLSSGTQIERWLQQLHAPTGLDLGAESPETVAVSILAEILKSFNAATALPLRQVRATR